MFWLKCHAYSDCGKLILKCYAYADCVPSSRENECGWWCKVGESPLTLNRSLASSKELGQPIENEVGQSLV